MKKIATHIIIFCFVNICINVNSVIAQSQSDRTIKPSYDYFKKSSHRLFYHTITQNQTPESIAKLYNLPTADVMRMNNLKKNTVLPVGEELLLEDRSRSQQSTTEKPSDNLVSVRDNTPSVYTLLPEVVIISEVKDKVDETQFRILQIENTKVAEASFVHFVETDDIAAYQKKATQEGKMLFVNFYADWCVPCKMMQEAAFKDQEVAIFMNQYCINIHINADSEKGKALRLAHAVTVFPTLLFYDVNSNEIARHEGALNIEDFKKFMSASFEHAKTGISLSFRK